MGLGGPISQFKMTSKIEKLRAEIDELKKEEVEFREARQEKEAILRRMQYRKYL